MKKIKSIIVSCLSLLFILALGSCANEPTGKDDPTPKDPISLAAPTVTLEGNTVSWNAVEHADYYVVSKNEALQNQQSTLNYKITDTTVGSYVIKVKAISANQEEYTDSVFSNSVTYTIDPIVVEVTEATLFLVGDSTVCSFSDSYYYPRYGYGTQISEFMDSKLTVRNLALSGRSSKSFLIESNYTTLKNEIKKGDYLAIGFGHNDEKSDDATRFTNASLPTSDSNSFKYSLYEYYCKLAIEKEATPILCTPIVRLESSNNYTGTSGHNYTSSGIGDYSEAIRELGEEKGIAVVDLTTATKTEYEALGYNEAIYYHAMTKATSSDGGATLAPDLTSVDKTHINIYGAKFVAYSFAASLLQGESSLKNYVLSDISKPTKDKELAANPAYTYVAYSAPALSSYAPASMFATTTEGWYGTAFGALGGSPESKGFVAHETAAGEYEIGQELLTGKFSSSADGFGFVFKQVSINDNFTITAQAEVTAFTAKSQAGFGLMLRDDCYINQTANGTVSSNFVAAGFLAASDTAMTSIFSRSTSAALTKSDNVNIPLYQLGSKAEFKIERIGQVVNCTVIYSGTTYTETFTDFDFIQVDSQYMYVGMFATRGTIAKFTNVVYTYTGSSMGA